MLRLRERTNTWPGFVDLFSNLVIILIFLLIVFVFLWTTTSVFSTANGGKKIAELRRVNVMQSEQLAQMSADEREARELLIAARGALESLEETRAELEGERERLSEYVASKDEMLQKLISDYERSLNDTQAESVRMAAQIKELHAQLIGAETAARDAEQAIAEAEQSGFEATIELVAESSKLQAELARLNDLLTTAETKAADQEIAYIEMSTRLNKALADRVAELDELRNAKDNLAEYQSHFYGAVRAALADFKGVDVSGDRFVISSDILFPSGSFALSPEGKNQLRIIATVMKELEARIPTDVNWIIRVDGHTDKKPVIKGTKAFRNNTELSLLRATAVVNELVKDGVSRRRLIPSGFGELFPAEIGNTPAALQKNRRIELRLTNP
ncbi:MAG: OmpA family protein [Alphaproteobacteria bacterium]|nr:OmpA family protein [Alphaproteobacteria bacterium]